MKIVENDKKKANPASRVRFLREEQCLLETLVRIREIEDRGNLMSDVIQCDERRKDMELLFSSSFCLFSC